ncbi:type IV secretion system protein [Luteibacter jiangsuensis]|uniref:Type IV secretion system protein n=1 Tax=Luteibacter jiangsuensis TaxID=637577 RepID=A0ABX0QDB6_9GAMM|nr:type IV secretion system protein [Luteibacter jiangsuensis]NID06763.1 type IV secretion system protein [Luteibacter jiangsuensis]
MPNITDYIYFRLVYDYLNEQISKFGMELMGRMMSWASALALVLVTLWILLQGYRILSGQSREPLMATVLNMGRIAVIVGAATTMAVAGTDLHNFLTVDLDKAVHGIFTGSDKETTADSIDGNLAWTQLALSTINSVQVVPSDAEMLANKQRASWIAAFGTASPPMAAGVMLLLYQFAMALFIGLGPLFILCLIFDQTKELFRRWIMYGIGTIFSMALLSVVCSIVLRLTIKINEAMWGAKIVNKLLGSSTEGLNSIAMQQGGIGLLLTALIVSVPPMAAMFFQGTLGNFLTYSAFGGAGSSIGPSGQPPGSWSAHRLSGGDSAAATRGRDSEDIGALGVRTMPSVPVLPQQDVVKSVPARDRM